VDHPLESGAGGKREMKATCWSPCDSVSGDFCFFRNQTRQGPELSRIRSSAKRKRGVGPFCSTLPLLNGWSLSNNRKLVAFKDSEILHPLEV
jgi:hypothetical protein